MRQAYQNDEISTNIDKFVSVFRYIFDAMFVKNDYNIIHANVVLGKLKERELDIKKIESFLAKLPEGQWNFKIFLDNLDELNKIFGISDEYIMKNSTMPTKKGDINNIRWEIILQALVDYTKFSNEFYDAFKYNNNDKLSTAQIKLLNELMLIFKYIKESSKYLYENYSHKKYSQRIFEELNEDRAIIEYFLLRILYVSLNLKKTDNKRIENYAKLLGKERISITTKKMFMPRYC